MKSSTTFYQTRQLALLALCVLSTTLFAAAQEETKTSELLLFGETEYLYIEEAAYTYDSRIDTGATTNSIHAEKITPFERDGENWVRFELVNYKTEKRIELEKPVSRVVSIKRHGTDSQERFVVLLGVLIGSEIIHMEFSLNNRENYSYPLLVGRNLLRGVATVDVSQSYVQGKPSTKQIKASQRQ
ncbi:ATP-dependent zinc protease family protein [Coraliomargarita akajimensis]|uniref:Retropepsin-like aspartic endopeptidase domain-containing protein n=1 Tax=Coraliomargarita akajimensis (strain DSM 45221 / IAM 15411 / JCM 23193 / KCTC 12865 / 04OKA010-24) TaxID=583355 RepID=D5EPU3_CORAD|nr:ATP-dependent zinc protease [Coraliomargarita akajimensis]ADE55676.1 protein of unknown function DUF785 [Coraliomargarita akajimensis DSM 45221]